jgi:hypothetical protein
MGLLAEPLGPARVRLEVIAPRIESASNRQRYGLLKCAGRIGLIPALFGVRVAAPRRSGWVGQRSCITGAKLNCERCPRMGAVAIALPDGWQGYAVPASPLHRMWHEGVR